MLLTALLACAPKPPTQHTLRGEALGTTWQVSWRGEQPAEAEAESVIVDVLSQIDASMSSWRSDSELSKLARTTGPRPVSEELDFVVASALDLASATGGAFDPTVEPLMALWGFRGHKRDTPPTEDEIEAARASVGWQRVQRSHIDGIPHIDMGGTSLDLSAIAKGHAVDRVSNALSAIGAAEQLVEIGGEVRTHGAGPREGRWRIGLDRPEAGHAPGEALEAVIVPVNAALATSGNYRSRYPLPLDGEVSMEVVHIMDPRTGRPRDSTLASASVIAPDCRTADGWATALMVLGPDGLSAIEARPDLEALLLVSDGHGDFTVLASSGMAHYLAPDAVPR